jgi:hypothetical protein
MVAKVARVPNPAFDDFEIFSQPPVEIDPITVQTLSSVVTGKDGNAAPVMRAEVERMTPARAADILAHRNTYNRPLSRIVVQKYAAQMREGRWPETGAAIQFDVNGVLADGQHRLTALVEAGASFDVVVVYNVPLAARYVLDLNHHRTGGHALAMEGYTHANVLASALRYKILWDTTPHESTSLFTNTTRGTVGNDRLAAYIARFPTFTTFCPRAHELKPRGFFPGGPLTWLLFETYSRDEMLATLFWEGVLDGVELNRSDVRFLLRERLLEAVGKAHILPMRQRIGLTIAAWNAFAEGRRLRRLVFGVKDRLPEFAGGAA